MPEILYEVIPTQQVSEKTVQQYYSNLFQKQELISQGYIPVDPFAEHGVAIKTFRELII